MRNNIFRHNDHWCRNLKKCIDDITLFTSWRSKRVFKDIWILNYMNIWKQVKRGLSFDDKIKFHWTSPQVFPRFVLRSKRKRRKLLNLRHHLRNFLKNCSKHFWWKSNNFNFFLQMSWLAFEIILSKRWRILKMTLCRYWIWK